MNYYFACVTDLPDDGDACMTHINQSIISTHHGPVMSWRWPEASRYERDCLGHHTRTSVHSPPVTASHRHSPPLTTTTTAHPHHTARCTEEMHRGIVCHTMTLHFEACQHHCRGDLGDLAFCRARDCPFACPDHMQDECF